MLLKIREKAQGAFAWIILVLICVPFALWGIQNYLEGGKEAPIASVGDKDFYLNDVNTAYQQFAQSLAGMKFDEATIKKQALQKLIRDEVLLQYVLRQRLVVTDEAAKAFIENLEYFQTDGKFDKTKYQALLASQRMSSDEFVARVKKALLMEQFQHAIADSAFTTPADLERLFRIQNQQRDISYVKLPLPDVKEQPSDADIQNYYQQHQQDFQTEEQAAVDYVELSLDKLAEQVKPTEEQLKAYYEEQKAQYTTKERRKISHILFAFTKDKAEDDKALQRALKAEQDLKTKDFAALAAEVSDDKLTAKNGGDLGLFAVGVMEKDFEEAASRLKLGEVSKPVKSAFGYHLIKVTELVPGEVKPYGAVKDEIDKAYRRAQSENTFNNLAQTMAEQSFENSNSLAAVAKALNETVKSTALFTKNSGEGIASEPAVRSAAFAEEVLKGNNSEPVELGTEKLLVLRLKEHRPSAPQTLDAVKADIIKRIQADKAKQQLQAQTQQLQAALNEGKSLADMAKAQKLEVKTITGFSRSHTDLPLATNQAVFKAAKPLPNQATTLVVPDADDGQWVISLTKVTEGTMSADDKAKQDLAVKNIAGAMGKLIWESVLNSLEREADVEIHEPKTK